MAYKVVVTNDAKENMQEYIEYILYEKRISRQQEVSLMILNILKIY
jgi:toxin ParE1/3/4